jgi:hypothetical protein
LREEKNQRRMKLKIIFSNKKIATKRTWTKSKREQN